MRSYAQACRIAVELSGGANAGSSGGGMTVPAFARE